MVARLGTYVTLHTQVHRARRTRSGCQCRRPGPANRSRPSAAAAKPRTVEALVNTAQVSASLPGTPGAPASRAAGWSAPSHKVGTLPYHRTRDRLKLFRQLLGSPALARGSEHPVPGPAGGDSQGPAQSWPRRRPGASDPQEVRILRFMALPVPRPNGRDAFPVQGAGRPAGCPEQSQKQLSRPVGLVKHQPG